MLSPRKGTKVAPCEVQDEVQRCHSGLYLWKAQSPVYGFLEKKGLLETAYQISSTQEIHGVLPNSSKSDDNMWKRGRQLIKLQIALRQKSVPRFEQFSVADDKLRWGRNRSGTSFCFLPGVHCVDDPSLKVDFKDTPITQKNQSMLDGSSSVLVIGQGFVGLCMESGEPVILPPGMHQWRSDTLKFEKAINVAQRVIYLERYTIITVDEGYVAITQNKGEQEILDGGEIHVLTDKNWVFERFMSTKTETIDLGRIEERTCDNVLLETKANVVWHIHDLGLAEKMTAEAFHADPFGMDDPDVVGEDIVKERRTEALGKSTAPVVLGVAGVSLKILVRSTKYSDSMHDPLGSDDSDDDTDMADMLFDKDKLLSAVAHANAICSPKGIEIISINIISAFAKDGKPLRALDNSPAFRESSSTTSASTSAPTGVPAPAPTAAPTADSTPATTSAVGAMSVKELKECISSEGLRHNDCVEKSDLRARAEEAMSKKAARASIGAEIIDTMSVKQLKEYLYYAGLRHDGCMEKSELRARAKEAISKKAEAELDAKRNLKFVEADDDLQRIRPEGSLPTLR